MNPSYREVPAYPPPMYYNIKAEPFIPSEVRGSSLMRIAKMDAAVTKESLAELLDSVISTNFEDNGNIEYTVVEFGDDKNEMGIMEDTTEDTETPFTRKYAILRIESWELCTKLIDILNGYVWSDCILDAKRINVTSDEENDSYAKMTYPNDNHLRYTRSQSATGYFKPYLGGFQVPYEYMYSHPNSPPVYPNYPESPRGYLSRRSSNKSNESRRSSRNNSFSNSTRPVPSFLMNLVNQGNTQTSSSAEDSETDSTSVTESLRPESITIENDDGQSMKVNPCRLFVGNIPYSSTWMSLKNFLVDKAKEVDPNNDISILRVEIPMQSQSLSTSMTSSMDSTNLKGGGNTNSYSSNMGNNEARRMKTNNASGAGEEGNKSRGFAIVTTGNKISSQKLIEYFDNVEFEGRSLTVRFDKFPDYNNYVLQQVHSTNHKNKGLNNKSSVLSLAFERNSFQHKFYYGNNSISRSYLSYPYYYNVPPPLQSPYPPYIHSSQGSPISNPYMGNMYVPNDMERGDFGTNGGTPRNSKYKKHTESAERSKRLPDNEIPISNPESNNAEITKSLESFSMS